MSEMPWNLCTGVSTGLVEIDRRLGGNIPWGSLVVVEGKHAAGKTVLCQHLTHSALSAADPHRSSVAYYSSETASPSLLSQMAELGLDVMDQFLLDRLRIFPLELTPDYPKPDELLEVLQEHIASQPARFQLVVVDSLTPFLPRCSRSAILDFVVECRQFCSQGRTVVLTLDSRPLIETAAAPIFTCSDVHLTLQMEAVLVEQVVKAMRVVKAGGQTTGAVPPRVHFNVQPGLGIQVLWPKRSLP
jgi:archaeal flagellar protein FlaH